MGRRTAVGIPGAGGASRRAVQVPVCGSFEGEQVCVQGWSTGLTYTYTGQSRNAQGVVFQEGYANLLFAASGARSNDFTVDVNWQGSGTLFVPLAPGI